MIDVKEAEELAKEYDKVMADGLESPFTAHEILGLAGLFKDRLVLEQL